MAFCSFSSELVIKNSVSVDNIFINEFLPSAPEFCTKVYLFGLYNCNNQNSNDNSLQSFARILNASEEDVLSAFYYWQDLGLVQVLNISPIEVRYLPVRRTSAMLRKYSKDKYKDFNQQAQEIIVGRMITTTEYNEYYYLCESLHLETDALIMIIKYCVDLQGNNVGYKYILTVAKNWAYSGITTAEKVEERLMLQTAISSDLKLVLNALGIKRSASIEEYQTYLEWTDQMGFENQVLVLLGKKVKKLGGGLKRLDTMLNKFFQMQLFSIAEIEDYLEKENELYEIAKIVCKNIGVRYENLEVVVETYVGQWYQYGFDKESLELISKHAFKLSIRTLEGLNFKVNQFFKLGLINLESISSHIYESHLADQKIMDILKQLNIIRQVNRYDKEFYNTWVFEWQINQELLDYAISKSADKVQPMQFLNKLLAIYHSKGIKNVSEAEKKSIEFLNNSYTSKTPTKATAKKATKKEIAPEELTTLFTSMDEVEI